MTTRQLGLAASGLLAGIALHDMLDAKPRKHVDPRTEALERERRARQLEELRRRAKTLTKQAARAVGQTFQQLAKASQAVASQVGERRAKEARHPVLAMMTTPMAEDVQPWAEQALWKHNDVTSDSQDIYLPKKEPRSVTTEAWEALRPEALRSLRLSADIYLPPEDEERVRVKMAELARKSQK